jgi:hypothetical protein
MTADIELLPCPCCGAHLPILETISEKRHRINCTECPIRGEFFSSRREQAIAAWNRRASIPQAAAEPGDIKRYEYLIDCEYQAARWHLPNLDEAEFKQKLRAKHDAAVVARSGVPAKTGTEEGRTMPFIPWSKEAEILRPAAGSEGGAQ